MALGMQPTHFYWPDLYNFTLEQSELLVQKFNEEIDNRSCLCTYQAKETVCNPCSTNSDAISGLLHVFHIESPAHIGEETLDRFHSVLQRFVTEASGPLRDSGARSLTDQVVGDLLATDLAEVNIGLGAGDEMSHMPWNVTDEEPRAFWTAKFDTTSIDKVFAPPVLAELSVVFDCSLATSNRQNGIISACDVDHATISQLCERLSNIELWTRHARPVLHHIYPEEETDYRLTFPSLRDVPEGLLNKTMVDFKSKWRLDLPKSSICRVTKYNMEWHQNLIPEIEREPVDKEQSFGFFYPETMNVKPIGDESKAILMPSIEPNPRPVETIEAPPVTQKVPNWLSHLPSAESNAFHAPRAPGPPGTVSFSPDYFTKGKSSAQPAGPPGACSHYDRFAPPKPGPAHAAVGPESQSLLMNPVQAGVRSQRPNVQSTKAPSVASSFPMSKEIPPHLRPPGDSLNGSSMPQQPTVKPLPFQQTSIASHPRRPDHSPNTRDTPPRPFASVASQSRNNTFVRHQRRRGQKSPSTTSQSDPSSSPAQPYQQPSKRYGGGRQSKRPGPFRRETVQQTAAIAPEPLISFENPSAKVQAASNKPPSISSSAGASLSTGHQSYQTAVSSRPVSTAPMSSITAKMRTDNFFGVLALDEDDCEYSPKKPKHQARAVQAGIKAQSTQTAQGDEDIESDSVSDLIQLDSGEDGPTKHMTMSQCAPSKKSKGKQDWNRQGETHRQQEILVERLPDIERPQSQSRAKAPIPMQSVSAGKQTSMVDHTKSDVRLDALYEKCLKILEHARTFRGKLDLQVQFGANLLWFGSSDDKEFANEDHGLNAAEKYLNGHDTRSTVYGTATTRLTSSARDMEYLLGVKENKKNIFPKEPCSVDLIYEFVCQVGNMPIFIVEVDQEGTGVVKKPPQRIGEIFWHFAKRIFDARVVASSTTMAVAPAGDPNVAELMENLYIRGPEEGSATLLPTIQTHVSAKDFSILHVFIKRRLHFKPLSAAAAAAAADVTHAADANLALRITEAHDLAIASNCTGGWRAFADPPATMAKEGTIWYEAALVPASGPPSAFAANEMLAPGEAAPWRPEDVMARHRLEALVELAQPLVARLDRVGVRNRGPYRGRGKGEADEEKWSYW
ncbi:MAG: hypothetical protein M1821_002823 [Bathelium mastoideum]|nr:MAG: hypothetical protein M1821_002823 [Bathelium mastoideum]